MIKHGRHGQLARLPSECIPPHRLIFEGNNHQFGYRVDIDSNGLIQWVSGGRSHSWLSLAGINFNTKGNSLALENNWVSYEGGYRGARLHNHNGVCVASGLIKSGAWNNIGDVAEECRIPGRLIFNLNNHLKTSRVDLQSNGQLSWHAGGRDHSWISLTGLSWVLDGKEIPLTNGWRNYNGGYLGALYKKVGDVCYLSGLIRDGGWGKIATMPEECRPNGRLVFSANNHQSASRVDVETDGSVTWISGGKSHSWLSLTGITYSTSALPLMPSTGWKDVGSSYRGASYKKVGRMCFLSGFLSNDAGSQVRFVFHQTCCVTSCLSGINCASRVQTFRETHFQHVGHRQ